jgi:hypothetical protein
LGGQCIVCIAQGRVSPRNPDTRQRELATKVTMAKRSPSMQAVSMAASDTIPKSACLLRSQRYVAAEQQNTLDTVFCRYLLGDNKNPERLKTHQRKQPVVVAPK